MHRVAGVDLGATNVRAAVAEGEGEFLATAIEPTPQAPSGTAVTEAVLDCLRAACADADVDPTDLAAVGVGSIGPLDPAAGAVTDPANLPADRVELVAPLSELAATGEISLLNDADAGVVGERFYGEAPDDAVYLTISTGIGSGVAVDGHRLAGRNGNAGEVGHLTVDPRGLRTCGCGAPGHWEAYCSGRNLPEFARLLHDEAAAWQAVDAESHAGTETDLPLDDPEFGAADVFECAGDDPFATAVVDAVAHFNAIGVANVVHAYAPSTVAVGGAVALRNEALVVDPVRQRLPGRLLTAPPAIRLATFGDEAVLRGAVASAVLNC